MSQDTSAVPSRVLRVRKRVLLAMVTCVLLVVLGVWAKGFRERIHRDHRRAALQQVWKAMEQYASANPGHYYPPRSPKPGVFLPDFEEWAKIAPDRAEFEQARKTLTDPQEHPICYTGYTFARDFQALQLADALEKDPVGLRGGGPVTREPKGIREPYSPEANLLHPARKGGCGEFVWLCQCIEGMGSCDKLDSGLPLLWEMPRHDGDVVASIAVAGNVSMGRYPGWLPVTRPVVSRFQSIMGLPQDPGYRNDSPILPILRAILEITGRATDSYPGDCVDADTTPSITVQGRHGYRVQLGKGALVLFADAPQAAGLPSGEVFPEKENCPLPRQLIYRPVWMGRGRGYCWYGKLRYPLVALLEEEFGLVDGEDLYPLAAAHCRDELSQKTDSRLPKQGGLSKAIRTYTAERADSGHPVSEAIIDASAILDCAYGTDKGCDPEPPGNDIAQRAKQVLMAEAKNDPEAVATAVLPYVLSLRRQAGGSEPTRDEQDLLSGIPRDAVIAAAKKLLTYADRPLETDRCRDFLKEYTEKNPYPAKPDPR